MHPESLDDYGTTVATYGDSGTNEIDYYLPTVTL